jgi:hypothetical protein
MPCTAISDRYVERFTIFFLIIKCFMFDRQ